MKRILIIALAGLASCEPMPGTESSTSSSSSGATASASGLRPLDAENLCGRLVDECGQPLTKPACLKSFNSLRVTNGCVAEIARATCADLGATTSVVSRTCFPACSGTLASCNADGTLTFCTGDGTTRIADCKGSCVSEGFSSWTGTCGTTYQNQVADRAQCWCQ